jgi:stage III sporulation protein SpoIIIAA
MTLEDGKTLVQENKKGYICYAKKKKDGRIVATCKKVKTENGKVKTK